MKGMPLPFDFEGKRVLNLVENSDSLPSNQLIHKWNKNNNNKQGCFVGNTEPTSVLDTIRSPSLSPPTSTSTLSFSLGGFGGTLELHPIPPPLGPTTTTTTVGGEKCGVGMEDWEGVLSESVVASPSHDQSMLPWIMGDIDEPSMALNKVLQISGSNADFGFNGGFGVSGQGFVIDSVDQVVSTSGNFMSTTNPTLPPSNVPMYKLPNPQNPVLSNNFAPILSSPGGFNPQLVINQHQIQHTQNPSFFMPLSHTQQGQHPLAQPNPKRHNPGSLDHNYTISKAPFHDSRNELVMGLHHDLHQRPGAVGMKPKIPWDESLMQQEVQQQQHQGIIDQLYKAAEVVQTGNLVLAQGILARLNQQLSPIGKPFQRAAFYCKEALQKLLHTHNDMIPSATTSSPLSLIFKIGAYKYLSEISPLLQFANFTCNQALLEVLQPFDRIHIIDFDIGYGGQWAGLMQELALRSGGAPALKITAFACPSTHDQLELGLTSENLVHFAGEINMAFEFDVLSLDCLNSASWSMPFNWSENEAIAVNLTGGSFSNYQLPLPLVLRFVKQLSPKIVVSVDRGCDRTDLPFPNHVINALQSYSNLLESLDAVNVNLDGLQKIERFLLQPGIEKSLLDRYHSPEKTQHWRTLFLSSGFCPLTFSNFTESQAECVVKRTPVRGFHVEKRQSSLVLCWQRKELISASAWRC